MVGRARPDRARRPGCDSGDKVRGPWRPEMSPYRHKVPEIGASEMDSEVNHP